MVNFLTFVVLAHPSGQSAMRYDIVIKIAAF